MIVLGLMSGTSLDGLDLVMAEFKGFPSRDKQIEWEILACETIEYSADWKEKLNNAVRLNGFELMQLHADYGKYLGESCLKFIEETAIKPEIISSHGHTVFHEPTKSFTTQIGDGNLIAAITGKNTVYDYRTMDVALGGQGAPLVPIGDEYLFSQYDACLNLGGIANISFKEGSKRRAFDICPFNLLLNEQANILGFGYDDGGNLAADGAVSEGLLAQLSELPFYQITNAKSLDKEKLRADYLALIDVFDLNEKDILATLVEHFATEIAKHIKGENCLITGGGAFNKHFVERLTSKTVSKIVIPNTDLINFKEALIFALMGYLRLYELDNILASATGSNKNSCAGSLIMA